jgi:hypothetical protein
VYLVVTQILLGVTVDEFLLEEVALSFRETVASSLNYNVSAANVTITCVREVNVSLPTISSRRLAIVMGVEVSYDVVFTPSRVDSVDNIDVQNTLQTNLEGSLVSGEFTDVLRSAGTDESGAETLQDATAVQTPFIITFVGLDDPDSNKSGNKITTSTIVASAAGAFMLACIFCIICANHQKKVNKCMDSTYVVPDAAYEIEEGKEMSFPKIVNDGNYDVIKDHAHENTIKKDGEIAQLGFDTDDRVEHTNSDWQVEAQVEGNINMDTELGSGGMDDGDDDKSYSMWALHTEHLREISQAGSHTAAHTAPTFALRTTTHAAHTVHTALSENEQGSSVSSMSHAHVNPDANHHELPLKIIREKFVRSGDISEPRPRQKYLQKKPTKSRKQSEADDAFAGGSLVSSTISTIIPNNPSSSITGRTNSPGRGSMAIHPSGTKRTKGRMFEHHASPRKSRVGTRPSGETSGQVERQEMPHWQAVSATEVHEHFHRSRSPRKLQGNRSVSTDHDYPDKPTSLRGETQKMDFFLGGEDSKWDVD